MENELQILDDLDQDMMITQSNIDEIKEQINYLDDIDSLILELRRIRENIERM